MKWTKRKIALFGVALGLFLLVVLLPFGGVTARPPVLEPAAGPGAGDIEITADYPWFEYYFMGWDGLPQVDIHITTAPK
ncbi:MAG: hypothetical protein ACFE89_06285 [Candidatus Hodarchaeota archaeon]